MIALVAALAMLAQDVLGTVMVQAEAAALSLPAAVRRGDTRLPVWLAATARRYLSWRMWLAGLMDAAQWAVAITTTTISVTAFAGHDRGRQVAVALAVTAANVVGTTVGQAAGRRLLGRGGPRSVEDRLAALERSVERIAADGNRS
jgi:hypothetical protein